MADDLDKKMEPEISEKADKAAEVIKEEVAEKAEKKAAKTEEKAAKSAEKAKDAAAGAATAAAAAVTASETAKEAEAAAKAAKKAEEQAAKEAAKQQAAAEKEAEKARIAKEKADAKAAKKKQKREAQQALIDACPPQYRPVSTSKYFWLSFLSILPCLGFIITLILSIIGRNRNVKNFERAILAYYLIGFILCLIAIIVVGVVLPSEARDHLLLGLDQILGSVSFG